MFITINFFALCSYISSNNLHRQNKILVLMAKNQDEKMKLKFYGTENIKIQSNIKS